MEKRPPHPIIPGTLFLLFFAELFATIKGAINLRNGYSNIPYLVLSSILLTLSILGLLVIFYESQTGQGLVTNSTINSLIYDFFKTAENWQIGLVLLGDIVTIVNISSLSSGAIFGIVMVGVAILYYAEDNKIKQALYSLLPIHTTISLSQLVKLIPLSTSQRKVSKILLKMVLFDGFPASLDLTTGVVTYWENKAEYDVPVNPNDEEVMVVSHGMEVSSPVSKSAEYLPKLICAYCGEEAEFEEAKFCSGCGASLSPAK